MESIKNEMLSGFLILDLEQMRPEGFHTSKTRLIGKRTASVGEGRGWKNVDCCPCCGNKENTPIMEKEGIEIVQCLKCSLGFSSRFPVDTHDVYCHSGYLTQAQDGYLSNVKYRMQRFASERIAILEEWLPQSKPKVQKKILDVGCGTGWFLECARDHGYLVVGQELGRDLAMFTSERLNIPIHSCALDEINEIGKFDAVTMFDVLEHTPDPVQQMRNIGRLLKPGGISLVFVPNLKSLGFVILQNNSALISPAEHLLYFTDKAIREVAERSGLEILLVQTKGMDIPDLIAYYRDELENKQVVDFLSSNLDLFQMIVDESGFANHMRVIFRKPV